MPDISNHHCIGCPNDRSGYCIEISDDSLMGAGIASGDRLVLEISDAHFPANCINRLICMATSKRNRSNLVVGRFCPPFLDIEGDGHVKRIPLTDDMEFLGIISRHCRVL